MGQISIWVEKYYLYEFLSRSCLSREIGDSFILLIPKKDYAVPIFLFWSLVFLGVFMRFWQKSWLLA